MSDPTILAPPLNIIDPQGYNQRIVLLTDAVDQVRQAADLLFNIARDQRNMLRSLADRVTALEKLNQPAPQETTDAKPE